MTEKIIMGERKKEGKKERKEGRKEGRKKERNKERNKQREKGENKRNINMLPMTHASRQLESDFQHLSCILVPGDLPGSVPVWCRHSLQQRLISFTSASGRGGGGIKTNVD